MKTCATCRFMAAEREQHYDDELEKTFIATRHTCVRIVHGNKAYDFWSPDADQKACVIDGSGYAARLVVLPTFGCVLHEEK